MYIYSHGTAVKKYLKFSSLPEADLVLVFFMHLDVPVTNLSAAAGKIIPKKVYGDFLFSFVFHLKGTMYMSN